MRYLTAIIVFVLGFGCAAHAGIVGAPEAVPPAPKIATDARPIYKIVADLTKGDTSARNPAAAEGGAHGGYKAPGKDAALRGPYDAEAKQATPESDTKHMMMKYDPKHALQSSYGATQSIQQRKSTVNSNRSRSPMASERVLQKRDYNTTHTRHGANKSYGNPYKADPVRKR